MIFLGTGGWISSPNRGYPSLALEVDNSYYIFDSGPNIERQIMKAGISPEKIKAVFITHVHGDHVFGLPGLAILSRSIYNLSDNSITVYAPYWCRDFLEKLFMFGGRYEKSVLGFKYFNNVDGAKPIYVDKKVEIYAMEMEHAVRSVAYKIAIKMGDGKKLVVYTSDTRPNKRLIEFSMNADIMIHEASLPDGQEEQAYKIGHSTPSQAIADALKSRVSTLILYHLGLQTFKQKKMRKNELTIIIPDDLDQIVL